jgi:hypothetical protein
MLSKANKHSCLATSSWLYDGPHTGCALALQYYHLRRGCVGTCELWAAQDTHQGFPRRALLAAPKGERPTSELRPVELPPLACPKGFRRILRKKYRRAVGTHYGPTRIRQAGFSLCHRRDGRAGTTILQLVSASDDRTKALISDYEPAGLPEQGQRRRIRREPQDRSTGLRAGGSSEWPPPSCRYRRTFPRTTGRPGAADAADDSPRVGNTGRAGGSS